MKVKKLVAILLTLILALGLLPMSAFSEGEGGVTSTELSNDSTASITIENAVENDEFKAYKVVDISYDNGNNTLTYAWNENFKDYFDKKIITASKTTIQWNSLQSLKMILMI